MEAIEQKQQLESEIVQLNSQLKEAQVAADYARQDLEREQDSREIYNKQAKKAEFNLEKYEQRWLKERQDMQDKVSRAEGQMLEAISNEREERQLRERAENDFDRLKTSVVNKDSEIAQL